MFKLQVVGNVCSDPVLEKRKFTNSKTGEEMEASVCNFTVAANSVVGEKKTIFVRAHAWAKLAESCHKNLYKGRDIYIEGEVNPPKVYINKNGKPTADIELTVTTAEFIGKNIKTAHPMGYEELPY